MKNETQQDLIALCKLMKSINKTHSGRTHQCIDEFRNSEIDAVFSRALLTRIELKYMYSKKSHIYILCDDVINKFVTAYKKATGTCPNKLWLD